MLWMFPDGTQAGISCTFDGFRDDDDRGESGFVRLKARAPGMTAEIGRERKLVTGWLVEKKITTLLAELL